MVPEALDCTQILRRPVCLRPSWPIARDLKFQLATIQVTASSVCSLFLSLIRSTTATAQAMARVPQIPGHVILTASELAVLKRDKDDALRQLEAMRKRCAELERELERLRGGERVSERASRADPDASGILSVQETGSKERNVSGSTSVSSSSVPHTPANVLHRDRSSRTNSCSSSPTCLLPHTSTAL